MKTKRVEYKVEAHSKTAGWFEVSSAQLDDLDQAKDREQRFRENTKIKPTRIVRVTITEEREVIK